jgi:hypothetical protein
MSAVLELIWSRPDGTWEGSVNQKPYHFEPNSDFWAEAQEIAGSLSGPLPEKPEPEPAPVTLDDFRRAIQAHIDATAQERGYDSGVSCASYVNSTNQAWASEASAFVARRDNAWAYVYAELEKVQSGLREQPTIEDILAELPPMIWPA